MISPKLPDYDYSLVIRADFSDDRAWDQLCTAIQERQTQHGFLASVEVINDETCAGISAQTISSVLPAGSYRPFVFLIDTQTIERPEHPVLVVDLETGTGQTFRVLPALAWAVENNLRLASMTFADFAGTVDPDGVLRGIPGLPT